MNNKFFIYKYSYFKEGKSDLSFIPMLIRRRLSKLAKVAFSTLYECFEGNGEELLFASQYGEFDSLVKIIDQYKNFNEVSPITFSNSVHNSTIGNFAILNKYTENYNAVSSQDETISNALADVISAENKILLCYADIYEKDRSFSCLAGKIYRPNSIGVEIILKENKKSLDEYVDIIKFLSGENFEYNAQYFSLRRFND